MDVTRGRPHLADKIFEVAVNAYKLRQERLGYHATEAIYCLRKAYWGKTSPLPPTKMELLYFVLGLGVQDALTGGLDTPAVAKDGIILSPDYWIDDELAELKTTRMSEKMLDERGLPEGWINQVKAYCAALGKLECLFVIIPIIRPDLLTYVVTFTQEEVDDGWEWLKARMDELRYCVENKEVPTDMGKDFECKNCRYKMRCGLEE